MSANDLAFYQQNPVKNAMPKGILFKVLIWLSTRLSQSISFKALYKRSNAKLLS